MPELQAAFRELFCVCLIAAVSDALLEDAAPAMRMLCGLAAALCVGRLARGLIV